MLRNVNSLDSQCIGKEELDGIWTRPTYSDDCPISHYCTSYCTCIPTYSNDCRISYSHLGNAIMYSPLCNAQLQKAYSGHYQSLQILITTNITTIANVFNLWTFQIIISLKPTICNVSIAKLLFQFPELCRKIQQFINLYSITVVEINILTALHYIKI